MTSSLMVHFKSFKFTTYQDDPKRLLASDGNGNFLHFHIDDIEVLEEIVTKLKELESDYISEIEAREEAGDNSTPF